MSASPFTFGVMFSTTTKKKTTSDIYVRIYFPLLKLDILVGKVRGENIQCYIILVTRTFILTSMTKIDCQQICGHCGYLSSVN